jgi:alkyl sulfatase BDS1-like metallo-beta-lactamase superfamily hydrolase
MNDALYGQLPFFDKTDFRNAHKGFIAPLPPAVIKGEKGAVIWNPGNTLLSKKGKKRRIPSTRACGVRRS